jgi:hypothetical protein
VTQALHTQKERERRREGEGDIGRERGIDGERESKREG